MAADKREPIAIIGMGCRFPGGANSPDEYWELVKNGVDAIGPVPTDRWNIDRFYDPDPDKDGKMYVRQGGFLDLPFGHFDANFFGISPREAVRLDPQQRLLLEVTWEALEDAGIPLERIKGSRTGVYVGAFTVDNMEQQLSVLNRGDITLHTAVSTTMTMLSNRISYTFDLRGPSITLDTACSSSLVSLHIACQSLLNGDCDVALSGGVNLMFRPEMVIAMCKGHFLSPTARCRTFDESADGYVRGEGAGIVVLKPLSAAQADGDRIHALICATGSNQDGHTSSITLPSGEAQRALIVQVCQQAGITPSQLQYVEAHGTGTQAGDVAEANSLGAVRAAAHADGEKWWVGSVKTNIGHLEAAAGIASVIKTVLALKHRAIPPHLHFKTVNPKIDLDGLGLRIPLQLEPWPEHKGLPYAGINSFGYGGTNAHAILTEAPPAPESRSVSGAANPPRPVLLPLSAETEKGLAAVTEAHAGFLAQTPPLRDMLYTATHRRSHLSYRLAVVGAPGADLEAKLRAYARGEQVAGVVTGKSQTGQDVDPVFVYTGMGPQWWGMGRELMQSEQVFREAVERCDALFEPLSGWSLVELFNTATGEPMGEPRHAQPANFALQVGLTELWRAYGIEPRAIVGHSVGEIAAAYAAGTLTLEDAVRVVSARAALMQRVAKQGAMLAASIPPEEAYRLIEEDGDEVSLAAINGSTSVTLAGKREVLQAIGQRLEAQGIFNSLLKVEVAYHSAQMEPLKDELLQAFSVVRPGAPRLPLYSTVTGEPIEAGEQDGNYWWRNARQTVLLARALYSLIQDGYRTFIEVGPHPVLAASIQDCLRENRAEGATVPSLRRQQPEQEHLLRSLGDLYARGCPVDWNKLYPEGRFISLPTYPWQREYLWEENSESREDRVAPVEHPILQSRLRTPEPAWEGDLSAYYLAYLRDHRIQDAAIFPAAGYVEAALAAAGSDLPVTLENLSLLRSIDLDYTPILQVRLSGHGNRISLHSRSLDDPDAWVTNAAGTILQKSLERRRSRIDFDTVRGQGAAEVDPGEIYPRLKKHGLNYGPHFQGIRQAWRGEREALAHVAYSDGLEQGENYRVHPAVLDAGFQTLALLLDETESGRERLFIPTAIRQVRLHGQTGADAWCYARLARHSAHSLEGDIWLCDAEGNVLAEIFGLRLQALGDSANGNGRREQLLYELHWEETSGERTRTAYPAGKRWLILADRDGAADDLSRLLAEQGETCVCVSPGEAFRQVGPDGFEVAQDNLEDLARLLEAVDPASLNGFIDLRSLDLAFHADERGPERVWTGIEAGVSLLHLIQALDRCAVENVSHKLYLVSANALSVLPDEPVKAPGQMVPWGMGRVITNEHATLVSREVDLDAADLPESLRGLAGEILFDDGEPEVALRGGRRYVHRMTAVKTPEPEKVPAPPGAAFALNLPKPGIIDSLEYRETRRRSPGPGEIEVQIAACGLNFKDLMKVLDLLPKSYLESTFYRDVIGIEASGVVVDVGPDVNDFRAGDGVIVFNPEGCFQSYVTVPARYAFLKPETLSPEDAVVFTNFLTAYYALVKIGRLQAGERVLIHSATGGVGLAAIQVARQLGAEVYATAGSAEKQDYLRAIGIRYVSDSRSLKFADDIADWTRGAGMDVVLNTLTGEALVKSFELLAPYGRFIEIGKRDINENRDLAMAAFDRNLTFSAVDLDQMLQDRFDLFRQLIREVCRLFQDGKLAPLPVTLFPADQTADAFRLMAQARHIGKVVVQLRDQSPPVIPLPDTSSPIRADGTYLVTGAFSGLGLEMAKWLVQSGARHLVLVSRSGPTSDEARAALESFREAGAQVLAEQVDIADAAQVVRLIERISEVMPPLRGIIHSAMVLDDDVMTHLDRERFEKVMAPKVLGAWHLHRHTLDLPLDFFVLFSSISALIGNARQANYVAANSFLDGLAHYRRSLGLPGMTIDWGSIARVGAVARNPKVEQYLTQLGIRGIEPETAARVLGGMLKDQPAQVCVVDMDWQRWADSKLIVSDLPLYTDLIASYRSQQRASGSVLLEKLLEAPPETLEEVTLDFLCERVSRITRISRANLDGSLRLDQLGMDSLMGLELNTVIKTETGVEFSVMTLMHGLKIAQLAANLLDKMAAIDPTVKAKLARLRAGTSEPTLQHTESGKVPA